MGMSGVPRVVLALCVAGCLTFLYSSCAAIGAAIGATGGGVIAGPAGAVVGGAAGAEAGDFVAGKKRAEKEAERAESELARARAQIEDLRATALANARIEAHNLNLPPNLRVASIEPVDAEKPRTAWYVPLLKIAALLFAVYLVWHFRAALVNAAEKPKAALLRIEDFLMGRKPRA